MLYLQHFNAHRPHRHSINLDLSRVWQGWPPVDGPKILIMGFCSVGRGADRLSRRWRRVPRGGVVVGGDLAAAVVLLSANIPLLFMGEEYGEAAPFQYWVSHWDSKLIEAVRQGRREEFAGAIEFLVVPGSGQGGKLLGKAAQLLALVGAPVILHDHLGRGVVPLETELGVPHRVVGALGLGGRCGVLQLPGEPARRLGRPGVGRVRV